MPPERWNPAREPVEEPVRRRVDQEPVPARRDPVLAVASAVGNRAFASTLGAPAGAGGVLARDPKAPAPAGSGTGPDLARQALDASDPSLIWRIPDLSSVPEETRIELIEMCNRAGHDVTGGRTVERLWDSFGPDRLGMMGLHHWETFAESLRIAPGLEDIASVDALEQRFRKDIRDEALRRLAVGEKLVAEEIARLEPMQQLPLEEQMNATYAIQSAAYQFERAQKADAALRKVRVRGDQMGKRPDVTRTQMEWFVEPAYFHPNDPPESTTYDDPATDPWVGLPLWKEVKWYHDLLVGAMFTLAEAQPMLHVAAGHGNVHDIAIAPEPRWVLEAALAPLRDSQGSIAGAKWLIEADELNPLDLTPVVEAVREGIAIPASRTPWHGLFYRWVASETIHEHSRDETVDRLLMGAASFALMLLGGWAGAGLTGALLMGGGVGIGVYQAAGSIEHANEMETVEGAKGRMGDDLVNPGTAAAAHATATVDSVVAFLNLLPLAALGRGAGAARGVGATAGAADDVLEAAGRAGAGAADDAAAGAGRAAGTVDDAGAGAGRTVPPAPVTAPPGAGGAAGGPVATGGPPGAAGGAAPPRNVTAMTVRETKEFFTRAVKRPSPLSEQNVELAVDRRTFELAWRNAGGAGRVPPAFTDGATGRVWVMVGDHDSLLLFHESIHQLSIRTGARGGFLSRFGSFLEEGVTEGLTRRHLGPQSFRTSYDRHVRFVEMMESRLGVSIQTIERAYIDGEADALAAAIRAGLGGDRDLAASFLMSLRNIGADVGDTVALRDAVHIMFTRQVPPT